MLGLALKKKKSIYYTSLYIIHVCNIQLCISHCKLSVASVTAIFEQTLFKIVVTKPNPTDAQL